MLQLPDVTLVCVDTRTPIQAVQAMRRCMAVARFGHAIFFGSGEWRRRLSELADAKAPQWHDIEPLRTIEAYNRFMLRDLCPHIHTSHVLIVQWDGYITAPDLWQDDFLKWDYIGAPWYHGGHPGLVGNGGFSLRSRRLLQALQEQSVNLAEPEDHEICINLRPQLESGGGIRIAPLETAQAFSCEYGAYRRSFGFHGMHNFAYVMSPEDRSNWLSQAPSALLITKHARKLVKELIRCGRRAEARSLIQLRSQTMGWTRDQCLLYLRSLAT